MLTYSLLKMDVGTVDVGGGWGVIIGRMKGGM